MSASDLQPTVLSGGGLAADNGFNAHVDSYVGRQEDAAFPSHGGDIQSADDIAERGEIDSDHLKDDPFPIPGKRGDHGVVRINDFDDGLHFLITHADGVVREQKAWNAERSAVLSSASRINEGCGLKCHRVIKVEQITNWREAQ